MANTAPNYGAFMEKFILPPNSSPGLPLNSLNFAVKDMFAVKGRVASFGNPDWLRTHSVATSTAPAILALLNAGATCVGTLVMDEMAYSILGENIHYGTPRNPRAAHRVPGGSSSGSTVAAGAELVDFTIGTDCIGSARIPASYCGTFGIRPSHGIVSKTGVIPMAQSLDTVGWFAEDPKIMSKVGHVLLQIPRLLPVGPSKIIIADDCFKISSIPKDVITRDVIKAVEKLYGGDVIKHVNIGDFIRENVPSLKHFMFRKNLPENPTIAAVSTAMQILERYEFKCNHAEWIERVKPNFGPGIKESIEAALNTSWEEVDFCHSVKWELRCALTNFLEDYGVLMIPTVPGPPPKLHTSPSDLENFNINAFSLVSVAGLSGCCQISIPLGMYNNLPISVSLVARHGADAFLLSLVDSIYECIKEEQEQEAASLKA